MRGKGFNYKGFTLVELLVTISILTILMTIALISYQGLQKNARDNKRKSDISTIQSALEQYHSDQGVYPSTIDFDIPFTSQIGITPTPSPAKTYMQKIPNDEQAAYTYVYTPSSTSGSPAACDNDPGTATPLPCINYCLYAPLENIQNAVNITACGTTPPTRQSYEVTAP